MSKSVNLAIIGSGVVGSAFLRQLSQLKDTIKYNVIYLAVNSRQAIIAQDYTPIDVAQYKSLDTEPILTLDKLTTFLKLSPKPVILVDNTSNAQLAEYYPKFVEAGISIATPNKKAFSSDISVWNDIFAKEAAPGGGLVYHEATVGAGLPIIGPLKENVKCGDNIYKIEGIFSGSLSFIFNKFSTTVASDVKFSDVVAEAKQLGYTEPDPRDDLSGMDVARKVTIVGRIAGLPIESPTSFPVNSLIPKDLESVATGAEFMEKLPLYDAEMQKLKDEAFAEGKVLRFVGSVDLKTKKASVGIEKYSFDHPFASLKGSDNVISITSERYPNPIVIQGAGAGDEQTAGGVLADTIKAAHRLAV